MAEAQIDVQLVGVSPSSVARVEVMLAVNGGKNVTRSFTTATVAGSRADLCCGCNQSVSTAYPVAPKFLTAAEDLPDRLRRYPPRGQGCLTARGGATRVEINPVGCCEREDCVLPEGTSGQTCAPSEGALCSYCNPTKPECKDAGAKCVVSNAHETFCGSDCSASTCPTGYSRMTVKLSTGTVKQCVSVDLSCHF